MQAFTFFYWSFLVFVTGLLVYASVFSVVALFFLLGGILTAVVYVAFLTIRLRRTGVWEHGRFRHRFHLALLAYIAVFWIVVLIITNVRGNLTDGLGSSRQLEHQRPIDSQAHTRG